MPIGCWDHAWVITGRCKSMVETSVVSCESWSHLTCAWGTFGENKYIEWCVTRPFICILTSCDILARKIWTVTSPEFYPFPFDPSYYGRPKLFYVGKTLVIQTEKQLLLVILNAPFDTGALFSILVLSYISLIFPILLDPPVSFYISSTYIS